MRAVCEPVFERPIGEISFGQLLIYLFRTAGRFDMHIQPSLVLLQKTLLNIEGLGRQLYPGLNLWDTAKPFLEDWVQERYSPQSILRRLQRQAPSWLEQLPQLPDVVLDSLQQSRDFDLRPTRPQHQLEEHSQRGGENPPPAPPVAGGGGLPRGGRQCAAWGLGTAGGGAAGQLAAGGNRAGPAVAPGQLNPCAHNRPCAIMDAPGEYPHDRTCPGNTVERPGPRSRHRPGLADR